jgi:Phage integrase family
MSCARPSCLGSCRWYALRHTFASHCLAAGERPVTVAKWLGHADVRTTYTFYAHALPDDDDQAAIDRLTRARGDANGDGVMTGRGSKGRNERNRWSRGRELNPRPTDYESVALPLSYPGL